MIKLVMRVDRVTADHVHETWFAGPASGTLAKIGCLCTTIGEYQIIGVALRLGAKHTMGALVVESDDRLFIEFTERESLKPK
jgi:hypothetical protein